MEDCHRPGKKLVMSKDWRLPPAYESEISKAFRVAESIVKRFEEGAFIPPDALITSVKNYLCDPTDPVEALDKFTALLSPPYAAADASEDPTVQASLAIGIVLAWATSETKEQYTAFRHLIRNSWWLHELWTKVAIVMAKSSDEFRQALLSLADSHFADSEAGCIGELESDSMRSFSLDDIWRGHHREARIDESSWPWVEILAELDVDKLFGWMDQTKSLLLLNRMLDSPELYNNFDLWESFILRASQSFESDGSWNGALLLPSLLRYGSATLSSIADSREYPPDVLEAHARSLLSRFVDAVASRSDFLGLFKRWGTWLTRQHLRFPDRSVHQERRLESEDIFWALADKVPPPYCPAFSGQLDSSWEPWVYQSMQALLHSKLPEKFPPPDVSSFIEEWSLSPTDWDSAKGDMLRAHIREYNANLPNSYACRVLGYSVALRNEFAIDWSNMWNSSSSVREILEFRPTYRISQEWGPSDVSDLMGTLIDVGLGILDCNANAQEATDPVVLKQSAALYNALWVATNEMMSIDFYGEEFWQVMQQHLVIRRLQWAVEAENANGEDYAKWLNETAYPTAQEALALLSTNSSSFISVLPLLLQNNISKQDLKQLIRKAGVDLNAIADSAAKFRDGPERKLKINSKHVRLINDLA